MQVRPVVYQPVQIVRPVAKVVRGDAEPVELPAIPSHPQQEGRGQPGRNRRGEGQRGRAGRNAVHGPAEPLAITLAVMEIERAFEVMGSEPLPGPAAPAYDEFGSAGTP